MQGRTQEAPGDSQSAAFQAGLWVLGYRARLPDAGPCGRLTAHVLGSALLSSLDRYVLIPCHA